ncbi:Na(+)-translocating NADH-quinone reductase subunit C [Seminibacterium arietis]|uniref:Na(+)-translocating NADH-quinone reductase subunit C n=1 Tax=Seminibacterium arietis TaxID=1173502 RepID=A0ABW3I9I7_9PAST
MFKNKDSIGGTISIVILVSLACSIIVAGSAVLLKPTQEEQKQLDKQKNILSVAGLLKPETKNSEIKTIFDQSIEARCVELDSGNYVNCPANFDAKVAAKDPKQNVAIPAELDKAGLRERAKLAEVYLVKSKDRKISQIVLPIYGTGLWSVMYGFVSVEPDGNTLKGITYYEHGETPGLGGEIENQKWQAHFVGKKLFNGNNEPAIRIAKGASSDHEHGIDSLSGATLTSKGVQGTFDYWFGTNGFAPYLTKLRAEAK